MSRNCSSFYWFFSGGSFFLLTYTELKAFNWLKTLFSAESAKKNARKELKRTAFTGHVNWLNVFVTKKDKCFTRRSIGYSMSVDKFQFKKIITVLSSSIIGDIFVLTLPLANFQRFVLFFCERVLGLRFMMGCSKITATDINL